MKDMKGKKVVILGAGYAGVLVAQGLGKRVTELNLDVVLINKHDYHQIITQLHEPAAGAKDGEAIRIPLNQLLPNEVRMVKGEVTAIVPENKQVLFNQNQVLEYDFLIVALGSEPEYFHIPGLQEYSYPLRSVNAARLIKVQIENCLARYKVNPQDQGLLNFVIGGLGFTGVEVAGELAEWLPQIAPKYDVPISEIKLICIEAATQVLPGLEEFLGTTTAQVLRDKGVELRLGGVITAVTADYVQIGAEKIATKTMIWTGGVRGNLLLEQASFNCHRGRAETNEYLESVNFDNVFIVGDCSYLRDETTGQVVPPTAQVAIQQGQHLVKNLVRRCIGQDLVPFRFDNKGVVASIGRKDAVGFVFGKYRLQGKKAVLMKKLINLRYLFILGGLPLVIKKIFGFAHKGKTVCLNGGQFKPGN